MQTAVLQLSSKWTTYISWEGIKPHVVLMVLHLRITLPEFNDVPLLSNHGLIYALQIIGSFAPYFDEIMRIFLIYPKFSFSRDLGVLENFS